jgi:hypothetical protein
MIPAAPDACRHPLCVRIAGAWICAECQATVIDDDDDDASSF